MIVPAAANQPYESKEWQTWRIAARLLWIDLKQGLRQHLGGAATWPARVLQGGGLLLAMAFFLGIHFAAYSLLVFVKAESSVDPTLGVVKGFSTLVWCFLLFVMVSGGLVRALVVLHEQDDSELLLSSPVRPRAILAARLLGNALQSCLVDGFIIVPWIDLQVLYGGPQFLWGYPVWFALAVLVTGVDGLFSFSLVRFFGLRRARSLAQIVPFFLVFGITFFSAGLGMKLMQGSTGAGQASLPLNLRQQLGELGQTLLGGMADAASGNAAALLSLGLLTLGLSWLTLRWAEKPFVAGTQQLHEGTGPRTGTVPPFRGHLLFLEIQKNLRLVVRTPMIIAQCLAQVLAPVGIAYILSQNDLGQGIAFFMIFAAGVLGGIFTIAAGTVEAADDLLRMAPKPELLFRLGKMLSGGVIALVLLAGAAVLLVLRGETLLAGTVAAAGLPLTMTSCLVGETFAVPLKPGQRPKLLHDPIMILPLLGTQMVSGMVAGASVLASAFGLIYVVAALVASYLLMVLTIGLAQLRKPLLDWA